MDNTNTSILPISTKGVGELIYIVRVLENNISTSCSTITKIDRENRKEEVVISYFGGTSNVSEKDYKRSETAKDLEADRNSMYTNGPEVYVCSTEEAMKSVAIEAIQKRISFYQETIKVLKNQIIDLEVGL